MIFDLEKMGYKKWQAVLFSGHEDKLLNIYAGVP
jgi:hypothetical protein